MLFVAAVTVAANEGEGRMDGPATLSSDTALIEIQKAYKAELNTDEQNLASEAAKQAAGAAAELPPVEDNHRAPDLSLRHVFIFLQMAAE